MPLRILLTHEMFLPQFAGGGEYLVARTAQELIKRGIDLHVLTTGDPAIVEHDGVPTRRLRLPRHAFAAALPSMIRMAKGADLIQTFNYHACLPSLAAARLSGKPIACIFLATFHEAWKEMKGPILGRGYMAIESYMIRRRFSKSIFLGQYSQELALSLGAPRDSEVLPIAIDLEKFWPAPQKENVVLFTGKYDVRKGVYDVLAAARLLPQVQFRMMGWGPEEHRIRAEAPPNVEFLPYDHHAGLSQALANASIFLLPSRAEAFPIALVQAMAAGCAVLFSKPLPFRGATIPPGDVAAIAEAIHRLWADPEATRRIGAENVLLAQQYSWENFGSRLISVYRQILPPQKARLLEV